MIIKLVNEEKINQNKIVSTLEKAASNVENYAAQQQPLLQEQRKINKQLRQSLEIQSMIH